MDNGSPPSVSRRDRSVDALLRLAGIVGVALACLIVHALLARVAVEHGREDATDGLLSLLAFLGATAGAAALTLGRHLFDRVEVARPWARS